MAAFIRLAKATRAVRKRWRGAVRKRSGSIG
jgi:hypothetical protein